MIGFIFLLLFSPLTNSKYVSVRIPPEFDIPQQALCSASLAKRTEAVMTTASSTTFLPVGYVFFFSNCSHFLPFGLGLLLV